MLSDDQYYELVLRLLVLPILSAHYYIHYYITFPTIQVFVTSFPNQEEFKNFIKSSFGGFFGFELGFHSLFSTEHVQFLLLT